jgi:rhodanese-related sulfurtransferase
VAPRTVDDMLREARQRLDRMTPEVAFERRHQGALLVDLRLAEQRHADGTIPGTTIMSLNHLEWRLDPTSDSRIPEAAADLEVILLCDEGYCSSLAAARLHELGVERATDVIGGFRAWRAAGLPVEH